MKQTLLYFDTTALDRHQLRKEINQAKNQNEKIMVFFKLRTGTFSPSQVHQAIFDNFTPITSVRRSISVLTKQGLLRKTELQVIGSYGKPEYKWEVA